jgi:predicted amidophosphoribosyltransferase
MLLCPPCQKWILPTVNESRCCRCLRFSKLRTCSECHSLGIWYLEIYTLFHKNEVLDSFVNKALYKEYVLNAFVQLLMVTLYQKGLDRFDLLISYPSESSSSYRFNLVVTKALGKALKVECLTLDQALSKEYAHFPKVLLFSCQKENPREIQEMGGKLRKQGCDRVRAVLLEG